RSGGGCDFDGSSPARLELRVVHHKSPVNSCPGNHAEPHETSRPAQSLRCSSAVLTARENETNTSGFTTVLKAGAAGVFAQFQPARRTHCEAVLFIETLGPLPAA